MSGEDDLRARPLCEGLAPFCCNNPDCPAHGDETDDE